MGNSLTGLPHPVSHHTHGAVSMPIYGEHVGGMNGDGTCYAPYSRPNTLFERGDTATTSHNVEVKPGEAWVIQAQGLTDEDCLAVEVVSGCGVGDMFTPYSLGCGCPVTLCHDRQRVVIPYPGRYRVVVSQGTPGDYRVTAYKAHDNTVSPGAHAMGCGCNNSPVQLVAGIANDANAMLILCNALQACIANSVDPDRIIQRIADDVSATAALCAAITPCIATVAGPLATNAANAALATLTGPVIVGRITSDVTALSALCTALAPCIDARVTALFPALITAPATVTALCTALTPCIQAIVDASVTTPPNATDTVFGLVRYATPAEVIEMPPTSGLEVVPTVEDVHTIFDIKAKYLRKRKVLSNYGLVTGASDQAAALAAAINGSDPGDYFDGQNETYRLSTQALLTKGVTLQNVNFELDTPQDVYPLRAQGSFGSPIAVSTPLTRGTYQVTVASAAGILPGQQVMFYRPCIAGTGFAIDSVAETWWSTVRAVVGNNIILADAYPSLYPLAASGLSMYVPTMVKDLRLFNVNGQRIGAPTNYTHFFRGDLCSDVEISGCKAQDMRESAFVFTASRRIRFRDNYVRNVNQEGYGYGIALVNGCEDFYIDSNVFDDNRHGVTMGGTAGIERNGFVRGNICRGSRAAGLDAHPAADQIVFDGNQIYAGSIHRVHTDAGVTANVEGIVYQGSNGVITNNKVHGVFGSTASHNAVGIFLQLLTRQEYEHSVVNGNDVSNVTGNGVIAVYVSSQKHGGSIQGIDVSMNRIFAPDFGANGVTSPKGVEIQTLSPVPIFGVNLTGNRVNTRSTALTVRATLAPIRSVSVQGGSYETINTDVATIEAYNDTAGLLERMTVAGAHIFGGVYGLRSNAGVNRLVRTANTIGGYTAAAVNGPMTALSASEIDS